MKEQYQINADLLEYLKERIKFKLGTEWIMEFKPDCKEITILTNNFILLFDTYEGINKIVPINSVNIFHYHSGDDVQFSTKIKIYLK